MTCKWFSRNRKVQCQQDADHTGMHKYAENGRTTLWDQAAAFIPKDTGVAVIVPDSFRAIKRNS